MRTRRRGRDRSYDSPAMPNSLFIQAPAKINLALAVGPADASSGGRHPICSWMIGIELCDDLTLTLLEADRFSRYAILWHREALQTSDIDWPIRTDLAVRAHLLLESTVGRRLPIQLKLEKRIPVGAGLGGGSSDAAAMLRGCNQLFELGLSDEALCELGATLGSDVPFFLRARSAVVEGFGECITTLADPDRMHFVLLMPDGGCRTAAVYEAFDELAEAAGMTHHDLAARFAEGEQNIRTLSGRSSVEPEAPFNHLTIAAQRLHPELREIAERAAELAESPVHMTGSGSAMFVVRRNQVDAQLLAEVVNDRLTEVRALAVSTHEFENR